jgi:hypothetical protein
MLNLNFLVAFNSVMGQVKNEDLSKSFQLMGLGMLGIFIVMLLIFLVIVLLNRFTGTKK